MSDELAIADVGETLRRLIRDRMEEPPGTPASGVMVTVGPPHLGRAEDFTPDGARLNLFLYRVTEHAQLNNQEIGAASVGPAYGHPPLSVRLYYLMTAYGGALAGAGAVVSDDLMAHRILGSAMRVFHDFPIITPDLRTVRISGGERILAESLVNECERLKVTLEALSVDDMSKIWTSLSLRYRVSVAYVVSVLQIESRRPRSFPRPVGQPPHGYPPLPTDPPVPGPMIYSLLIRVPSISDVRVLRPGDTEPRRFPFARVNDRLVISGTNLAGGVVRVRMGRLDVPAQPMTNDRLEVDIPEDVMPNGSIIPVESRLQPGVQTLSVELSDALAPQSAMRSNDSGFMLVPLLATATLAANRTVTLTGSRLWEPVLSGEVLIGRAAVPKASFVNPSPTAVTVPIPPALPARGVCVLVGGVIATPIVNLGNAGGQLDLRFTDRVGGAVNNVAVGLNLQGQMSLADIARGLEAAIRRAGAALAPAAAIRPTLLSARVGVAVDRLVVVFWDFDRTVTVSAASAFATATSLDAAPPAGVANAMVSGVLVPFVPVARPTRQLAVSIAAGAPTALTLTPYASMVEAAAQLQAALQGASGGAQVHAAGDRLVIVPGAATAIAFSAAPLDADTVGELQLRGRFAVRVRVNGAESVDIVDVDLPQ